MPFIGVGAAMCSRQQEPESTEPTQRPAGASSASNVPVNYESTREGAFNARESNAEFSNSPESETPAAVCSNCQRMLRRRRPWLAIAELRSIEEVM